MQNRSCTCTGDRRKFGVAGFVLFMRFRSFGIDFQNFFFSENFASRIYPGVKIFTREKICKSISNDLKRVKTRNRRHRIFVGRAPVPAAYRFYVQNTLIQATIQYLSKFINKCCLYPQRRNGPPPLSQTSSILMPNEAP